jgi:hypothetical protein
MLNKKFENKITGEKISIRQDDGVWFELNNGSKIKKEAFFTKYNEILDPNNFFSNGNIQSVVNDIKKIDTSNLTDNIQPTQIKNKDNNQITTTINTNPNYPEVGSIPNSTSNHNSMPNYPISNPNYPEFNPNIKRDRNKNVQPIPINKEELQEDETYKFFRGFKKNTDITIELKINEKIADPEFLKLMMNNFEADVIKFYTKEIIKIILNDPKKIENEIYNQLKIIIDSGKDYINNKSISNESIKPINDISNKSIKLIDNSINEQIEQEQIEQEQIEQEQIEKIDEFDIININQDEK